MPLGPPTFKRLTLLSIAVNTMLDVMFLQWTKETKQYRDAVRLYHKWHYTKVWHVMLYHTSQASSKCTLHWTHNAWIQHYTCWVNWYCCKEVSKWTTNKQTLQTISQYKMSAV
jgi:hypothetical protein